MFICETIFYFFFEIYRIGYKNYYPFIYPFVFSAVLIFVFFSQSSENAKMQNNCVELIYFILNLLMCPHIMLEHKLIQIIITGPGC